MIKNERQLIDKEPIKKFIEDGLNNPDRMAAFGHDAIEILAEIEYAPTMDAVEVVRCKDCKQWNVHGTYGKKILGECGLLGKIMNYEDFCSRGERRIDG